MQNKFLEAALRYAEKGWHVFPCAVKEKKPITPNGVHDATTDAKKIEKWWSSNPTANIGISCGASGLVVIDVDSDDAHEWYTKKSFPRTATVQTSRGFHYYFKGSAPNTNSTLAPNVDTICEGKYVLAPPSLHPNGHEYQWNIKDDPAPAPEIVIPEKKEAPPTPPPPQAPIPPINSQYITAAIESEQRNVALAEEGTRNDTLNRAAFSLGTIVAVAPTSEPAVVASLRAAAIHAGLEANEADATIRSGLTAGKRHPRQIAVPIVEKAPPLPREEDEWGDPQPLVAQFSRSPFPLDALPESIRSAVEEVQAFTQAPASLVASCALSAVSLACQAIGDEQRADGLSGPSSLYILTIADSGERKSQVDKYFTEAIRAWEATQILDRAPVVASYRAKLSSWEAQRAGIVEEIKQQAKKEKDTFLAEQRLDKHEKNKPLTPLVPVVLLNDETPESLAQKLALVWPSSGVVSAEAGIVFGGHAMNADSAMRNLALLNTLWDGGVHRVGRKTSDSITVQNARLTVSLQVQEETMRSFFDRTGSLARGSGFLARFLLTWPDSTQGKRAYVPPPNRWPALSMFNHKLVQALDRGDRNIKRDGVEAPMVLPSLEAFERWKDCYNSIEGSLARHGHLYDIRDVAAKTAHNISRMATLFSTFDGLTSVSEEYMDMAIILGLWYLGEARAYYSRLGLDPEVADATALEDWMISYCRMKKTQGVSRSAIMQYGPTRLRSKAALNAALDTLIESGRARKAPPKDGDRTRMIEINPALF